MDVCSNSCFFDSHQPFDTSFKRHIHDFLHLRRNIFKNKKYRRIVILDDGGELLEDINKHLRHTNNIIGIEQTSSGFNKLRKKAHPIPIINLARSTTKLKNEPRKIISKAMNSINSFLEKQNYSVNNLLIVGNGAIGSSIYNTLKGNHQKILTYDIKPNKSDIKRNELNSLLPSFDLLIGCTGVTSISHSQHHLLKPNCILANLASSDREFDAVHLRKQHKQITSCFQHLHINSLYLLNSGFPVNFDNSAACDDPNFFQLIRALIMASIFQALNLPDTTKSFIDLDSSLQKKIKLEFSYHKENMTRASLLTE